MLCRIRVATVLVLLLFVFQPTIAKAQTQQIDHTVYQDFIKQCIGPAVQKAVNDYYGEYRRIEYWQTDILNIKRLREGSYYFEITVRAKTSKGSFMPPYGVETITLSNLTTTGEGDYKVVKFVHQNGVSRT